MKKVSILFVCALMCSVNLFAKDFFNKKDKAVLPEAGDWGLSINATPILDYLGNFIGGNGNNNAPTLDFLSGNQLIYIKYFKDNQLAYRGGIRLDFHYDHFVTKTPKAGLNDPFITVDNTQSNRNNTIIMTGGLEKRFGKTRLQGFYGAEGGLMYAHQMTNFTYGNVLYAQNPGPQNTKTDLGINMGLGARAFLGLEYFIFPKISLGGEFGWGVSAIYRTEGERTFEVFESNVVVTKTQPIGSAFIFNSDTNSVNSIFGPMGSLRVSFYL
ncbi:MAG: hypothetical protein VB102_08545 [Paludibacter sp.]|nr:hypothetical protein [Paludibacter sp.]